MDNAHVYLFTDGSAHGTGVGAWSALIVVPATEIKELLYGVSSDTTINRCELMPITEGLGWIVRNIAGRKKGIRVKVISDSETTVRIMGGDYEPSANPDLWAAYNAVVAEASIDVTPVWRDRNSHPYMELVDMVCYSLRKVSLNHAEVVKDLKINVESMEDL